MSFESIPLDVYANAVLVRERVRPAMLLQPNDYGEASGNDPNTAKILKSLKKKFPELIYSDNYEEYQGIIISYNDYNSGAYISLEQMGNILGYPCSDQFENINKDDKSVGITILVNMKNGDELHLLANKCTYETKTDETKLEQFQTIAKNAETVLKQDPILSDIIKDVTIDMFDTIPTKSIINTIIAEEPMTTEITAQIINIFYNMGFSEDFARYYSGYFSYKNPIHKGILLAVLIEQDNDKLSVFYPLQQQKNKDAPKMVDEITQKQELALIDAFKRTNSYSQKMGGKKTRKHKK